jgi:hypothetical protein
MKKQLLASVCWQPGPWARYQNTFTTLIKNLGYAPGSIQNQTQLINRFAEWLRRRQTETKIHCLDETMVQRFLRSQQNPSSERRGNTATLHRFLYVLRQQGVVPPPKKTPLSPRQRLINNYQMYLLARPDTGNSGQQCRFHQSVPLRKIPKRAVKSSQLHAPDVTSFVRHQAHKLSPGRAQLLVTALRSFLRYLLHQGKYQ